MDEARKNQIAMLRSLANFMEENPDGPKPSSLDLRTDGATVNWWTYSAEDMDVVRKQVGAQVWDKDDPFSSPSISTWKDGIRFRIYRGDLHCEMVETGEVEEYETEEVVTPAVPAVTRTVTRTKPVMKRVCPPITQ